MEYLQRREKPDHYTWESWHSFANKQFKDSQNKAIEKEKQIQAQIDRDRKIAEKLSFEMTRKFLPTLEVETETDINKKDTLGIENPPKNVLVKQEKPDNFQTFRDQVQVPPDQSTPQTVQTEKSEFQKTVDLSNATVNFLKEVSELVTDPDVLVALRKLKFVGKQMMSENCDTETFQNELDNYNAMERNLAKNREPPVQQPGHVRNLDFGTGSVQIKQERTAENPPKAKPVFSGAKRMSFEQFQENFQSKRKKPGQSPARGGGKGFTSPPAKPSPESYKAMTDSKMDIIGVGVNVLKMKKTTKNLQSLWVEAEQMNRGILSTQDTNFYQLLAAFDVKYDKLSESVHGHQLKQDLFDFILSKVEYTHVSNKIYL